MRKKKREYYTLALLSIIAIQLVLASSITMSTIKTVEATDGQETLFTVWLMTTTYNPARRQWCAIIQNSLKNVGIDAKLVFVPFTVLAERSWIEPKGSWEEGGWDIQFLGLEQYGFMPDPGLRTASWNFPPSQNAYQFNDSYTDELVMRFERSTDWDERLEILKEWQWHIWNQSFSNPIFYAKEITIVNPKIENMHPAAWVYSAYPHELKGKKTIVHILVGDIGMSMCQLWNSDNLYEKAHGATIFEQLTVPKQDLSGYEARLATDWEASSDLKTWTVYLREGVKWHDGVEMTADDVVYSMYIQLVPECASISYGFWKRLLGDNPKLIWLNGSTTKVLPEEPESEGWVRAVDKYTVEYHLVREYGLLDTNGLSNGNGYIVPKHVLEPIGPANIRTHSFSTGLGKYTITKPDGSTIEWEGPVGTGPYQFVSWDPANRKVTMKKFYDYWNRENLEKQGLFEAETFINMQVSSKEAALSMLKSGQADILHSEYKFQKEYAAGLIDPSWGKVIFSPSTVCQELMINMRHPVLGTGEETPLGKKDPSRAAEAAWHVRQAINHLIPRELIIESILAGMGVPGSSTLPPACWGFDESIPPYEYSVEKALEHLAAAGYDVGKIKPSLEVAPIAMPEFILGMSTHVTGTFVDPVSGEPYKGMTVIIQESVDKVRWINVAVGSTDDKGRYDIVVTPGRTGTTYYRAFFPGVTVEEWGPPVIEPGLTEEEIFARYGTVAAPIYSFDVVEVEVVTLEEAFRALEKTLKASLEEALNEESARIDEALEALPEQVPSEPVAAYAIAIIALALSVVSIVLTRKTKR